MAIFFSLETYHYDNVGFITGYQDSNQYMVYTIQMQCKYIFTQPAA